MKIHSSKSKVLLVLCLTVCVSAQFLQPLNHVRHSSKDFSASKAEEQKRNRTEIPKITINETAVDNFITTILNCKDSVNAVAVAIVQLDEDDIVVADFNRSYGFLNPVRLEEDGEVDEFSTFCIGSITKQFTAALVGVALEQSGMDYDAKLIDVLGEAGRFFDEKGLDQLPTVRDLLSHRMSIPRYDTAWLAGLNGTRLDYWPKLHMLEDRDDDHASQKFRSSFEYNNWMVSLAGYVSELLTNSTWEAQVIKHYFVPLGLHHASFASIVPCNETDVDLIIKECIEHPSKPEFCNVFFEMCNVTRALPGYRIFNESSPTNSSWIPMSSDFMKQTVQKVAPAGAICLSSNDMLKYMTFILNSTDNEEERILKKKIKQTMYETSNFMPPVDAVILSEPTAPLAASNSYALTWAQGFYREYEEIWHDGSINGYLSYEGIFPKLKLGIFVSTTNGFLDSDQSAHIARGLFDLVMGQTDRPVTSDFICNNIPDSDPEPDRRDLKPFIGCDDTKDADSLKPLAGTYRHPVFGDVIISYDKDAKEEENRFTFAYGKFFNGRLCPKVEDKERKEFTLFFDPLGPLFFYNDPEFNEANGMSFIFTRDKASHGTSIVFLGLEKSAPVDKQTYYKVDYHACDPNPCKNGGTCELYGERDFQCTCVAPATGTLCEKTPLTDCSDWKKYHPDIANTSGVYPIQIPGIDDTYNVYCDMLTDGGGWTVIHRRFNETNPTNFNVSFDKYVDGFGLPGDSHSYWIGLNAMSHLADSAAKGYTLRIDLEDCIGRTVSETYQNFWIGDDTTQYTLHVKSGGTGTAGDALTISNSYFVHNNMKFSTPDTDDSNHCASIYSSGWWFNNCFAANLNGIYNSECKTVDSATDGITWIPFHNNKYSMFFASMKIRRS